ncbi:hypothetical protein HK102_003545 [Quaeritorhiza haematococci]|nr:hypothetical protein HK102_003545 [Quaeritorhiza haematococci]
MFPRETCNEIGAWLPDNANFANLAVALRVKWDPATQAQRMIRKYGPDFLDHVPIADEMAHWDTGPTRTKRGYITLSTKQVDFYRFLIRRMLQAVERHVLECLKKNPDSIAPWEQLEALFQVGYRLPVELKTDWIHHAMDCEPAAIELMLENGVLGDHNLHLDAFFEECFDRTFHCSWLPRVLRWGIPVDLDALLVETVDHTTQKYELIEEDRIINGFNPRAQYQVQCFIQQLLEFGANLNVITWIPTDPGVISVLMLHGADPNAAGWSRRYETRVWGSEEHIVKTWAHYGWLPPAQHAGWFFNCLVDWGCWGAVDVFMDHFGRNLVDAACWSLRKMIEHRKMDFALHMVAMFPEILADDRSIFGKIVKWYAESDWTLNWDLIEKVLSTGCLVGHWSILLCIQSNQRDIARKALYQRQMTWTYPSEVEKLGVTWAVKLVQDFIPLRQIEDRRPFWADSWDSRSGDSGSGDSDLDSNPDSDSD